MGNSSSADNSSFGDSTPCCNTKISHEAGVSWGKGAYVKREKSKDDCGKDNCRTSDTYIPPKAEPKTEPKTTK